MSNVEVNNVGEISLYEIFQSLYKQKIIIFISIMLGLSISGMYLLITKPTYEAKAIITAPMSADIQMLNMGRDLDQSAMLKPITVAQVYNWFADALFSESVKRDFFEKIYVPSLHLAKPILSNDKLYSTFSNIRISKETNPNRVDPEFTHYILTAKSHDPNQLQVWLKAYLNIAKQQTILRLDKNIISENRSLVTKLKQQIDRMTITAKKNRLDRLAQLKEALFLAQASNMRGPVNIGSLGALNDATMIYMRGSTALLGEIKLLESRKDDGPFIPNLRNIEEMYNKYSNIEIPINLVKMYRLDGGIEQQTSPISPRPVLVMLLGLFVGFVLGCFLAFCRANMGFLKTLSTL